MFFTRSLKERNWLIEEKTLLSPSQERVLNHWEVQVDYKILPIEGWKWPLDSLGNKIAGEYCKQVLLVENCFIRGKLEKLKVIAQKLHSLDSSGHCCAESSEKAGNWEWNWVLDPIKPKHLPSTLENALRKEVEEEYVVPKGKNKSRGVLGSSWALWHHQTPGKFLNKTDFQTSAERQLCGSVTVS